MNTFENSKMLFSRTLIAAALAAGLGAAATARADAGDSSVPQPQNGSVAAANADTAITAQVKARYLAEDRLKASDISVTTTNGAVTLSGTLPNPESKAIAVELAKSVEGVKSVDPSGLAAPGG